MQPISTPPKAGSVAFKYGLIFGIIQVVIASIVLLLNDLVFTTSDQIGLSLTLGVIGFLTGLAAYFVAGIFAARQTGKVSTGTFAGMWTGGIYGIIDFVLSLVLFFTVVAPRISALLGSSSSSSTAFNVGGVGGAVFGLLFAIGLGAGLGALGGLVGKSMSGVQPVQAYPPYQPAPYVPTQPAGSEQVYPQQSVQNPYAAPQQQPVQNPYTDTQPQ